MSNLYSKVRNDIKTGDLLAWRVTKITSFFTFILFFYQKIFKAKYSHVAIAVNLGNRTLMVEATPPVVRLFPVSMTDGFYHIKTNTKVSAENLDSMLQHTGKKYGLTDLLKGMLHIGRSDKRYYCSELCGDFYNSVGYIQDDKAGLTPDTLVEAVQKVAGTEANFIVIDRGNLTKI